MSDMAKIAVDCREFEAGRLTGIGRLLQNFVRSAPGLRPGWEFLLLTGSGESLPFPTGGNVRVSRLRGPGQFLRDQLEIPALLRRECCSLFYSPYPKVPLFCRVPSVMTIHDLTWLEYPGYSRLGWPLTLLTRAYAARAGAVITDSESSRADAARLLGREARKLRVCPAGVDTAIFSRREQGPAPGTPGSLPPRYVLYVGNARPHKNLGGLIAGYALLPGSTKRDYPLVLAGVGDWSPGSAGAENCVLLPSVSEGELPALYAGASAFVFPSFREGFGLPPLEAMACGCPVASSSASCMPEILGDACLYFDPASPEKIAGAISSLLAGGPAVEALRRKGSERAGLYSPRRSAEAILGVLESCLPGSRGKDGG